MKKIFIAFILLSLGSFCKAEVLPEGTNAEVISDFSGGLNTSVTPSKLALNFTPSMSNVYIDETLGQLRKRGGSDTVISTSGLSTIVFSRRYVDAAGVEHLIISDNSTVLQTDDFQTFTSIKTNLSGSSELDGVQVNDEYWFSNGSNSVFKWNGTTTNVLDGNNGFPDVPKGKYIEYHQNRVWLFNTTRDASEVRFCSVTSSDGFIVSPSSAIAWPEINQFYVSRGDGQVGTGMKADWGILSFYKENNLHKLLGDDEFTYRPYKVSDDAGTVSDKTIVFLDGYEYFLDGEGIYRYNGTSVERISDAISTDVSNFYRTVIRTGNVDWSGSSFNSTYGLSKNVDINGFGEVVTDTATIVKIRLRSDISGIESQVPLEPNTDGVSRAAPLNRNTWFPSANFTGYVSKVYLWTVGGSADANISYSVYEGTGDVYSSTQTFTVSAGEGAVFRMLTYPDGQVRISTTTDFIYSRYTITNGGNARIGQPDKQFGSSGDYSAVVEVTPDPFVFESVIGTATPINRWNAFVSERNLNGGSISYAYRTVPSNAAHIATQPYIPIVPGATIGSAVTSSTTYIQWIATFTPSAGNLQYILNASADYTKSGSNSDKAAAARWDNRYWLSVTTDSNTSTRLVYVKAKNTNANPVAFMRFQGLDVTSFVEFNNFIYAGIEASTGCLKQLEVGTEDDGQAIHAHYETPNLALGSQFFKKNVQSVLVDLDKEDGAIVDIQTSANGADFTSSTRTISGSGRGLISVNNAGGRPVNNYRIRIENADIDKDMKLNGIAIIYQPTAIQGDK